MPVDVSVIIPAYNAEQTIARCLDSVLRQRAKVEVIVVDDCSSDGTTSVCRAYCEAHGNVVLVRNARNIGQGFSRNRGIELARGRYLCFVDADDLMDDHMLEDLLSLAGDGCDVVRCGCLREERDPGDVRLRAERLADVRRFDAEGIRREVLPLVFGRLPGEGLPAASLWSACTGIYRAGLVRACAVRFASERELYSEDLFFNLDVLAHAETCATTESPYYCYFVSNPGSTTHRYHDPRSKCALLLERAAGDAACTERARVSVLNSLVDAARQLLDDGSYPWREKRRILSGLGAERLFAEARAACPDGLLTWRTRLFFACALRGLAAPALAMALASRWSHGLRRRALPRPPARPAGEGVRP